MNEKDAYADRVALALAAHERGPSQGEGSRALLQALDGAPGEAWLACAQTLTLRRDTATAHRVLTACAAAFPNDAEVQLAYAGSLLGLGDAGSAERVLRELLQNVPRHPAATFLLARLLRNQGRVRAASAALEDLFPPGRHDPEQVIAAVELLGDCDARQAAASLCERQLAAGGTDTRLHAYAAVMLSQLGQFEQARAHYEQVLALEPRAADWHVPLGLSSLQRYASAQHPDFDRFAVIAQRTDLGAEARASLEFALGKAWDDVGAFSEAARHLRAGNALRHTDVRWSRKRWRQQVDVRMAGMHPGIELSPDPDWTPVFILGLPRSGTTLLAERLGRHPMLRSRGELPWLPTLGERLLAGPVTPQSLARAALDYAAQLRRDDADGARWFVDKQPYNMLYVDLLLAMFPHARIVLCERNARDNALSIWQQSFQPGTHDYAYDLADIAAVVRGFRRLAQRAERHYADRVWKVRYEHFVAEPDRHLAALSTWLGLPGTDPRGSHQPQPSSISTASLWQARQPIHTRSVGRWRDYVAYVPELGSLPDD
ncbi:MAG TPA: sulfotransferase [Frateuria sp.]|uniref:tetratricopeptide repeat-containing sulfotransferase family protein n=1 Tax=Frateuria sp. TaxID=2211372 RepID=UPI002D7F103B|nr:sulfotransferase [Frateuria sp.]HET6804837.1 sulfotransferase [Frateuria sp.]